jgi:hypothetical protein
VVPLIPERPATFFHTLTPEVTNIQTTTQKLESDTIVLELNISSAASAFLQRVNRTSTAAATFIPSYRNVAGCKNQLHHVLAKLYLRIHFHCVLD